MKSAALTLTRQLKGLPAQGFNISMIVMVGTETDITVVR